MDSRSVFFDEWLRSLREQYKHVVRSNDAVTLPTLTAVMQNVGFGEDELAQLRIEATMHVDDLPGDFTPDLQMLEKAQAPQTHPAECLCPQCAPIDETAHDADGQPVVPDPEIATADTGHTFPVPEVNPADDDEPDPQTFEDSLDQDDETADTDSDTHDSTDEESADDDPDAPLQMSLL